jgi:hypothetical protein
MTGKKMSQPSHIRASLYRHPHGLYYACDMQQGSIMNSARHFRRHSIVAAIAALGMTVAAWPAAAQHAQHPQVVYIASADSPPPPAGMQLVCVTASNDGAPTAKTCPVVQYQGVTTWPFSYADNRTSLALVSYDSSGKIIGTVEKRAPATPLTRNRATTHRRCCLSARR